MQDTVADHLIDYSPTITWSASSGHAVATFTAPWDGWIVARSTGATNLVLVSVGGTTLNTAKAGFLNGYQVAAGATVSLKITSGAARAGDAVSVDCQYLPAATAIAITGASFDNTGAGSVSLAASTFDNGAASSITITGAAFDNGSAGTITLAGSSFDNTGATPVSLASASFDDGAATPVTIPNSTFDNTGAVAKVIEGEQSPVSGVQSPSSPTTAAHTDTLVAGTNYLVQVGSRAAPVTINLPDPGALGQRIESADTTAQGVAYPITVNAGSRDIETAGVHTYLIDRDGAVLALYYTGTKWKLF